MKNISSALTKIRVSTQNSYLQRFEDYSMAVKKSVTTNGRTNKRTNQHHIQPKYPVMI